MRVDFGYGIDDQPSYYSRYSTREELFKADFYISREHVLLGRDIGSLALDEIKSYITISDYSPPINGINLAQKLSLSSNLNLVFSYSELAIKAITSDYEVEYEWYDSAIIDGINNSISITMPSSTSSSSSGVI